MKHKTDAKELAQELIAEHLKSGITPEQAKIAATTTVQHVLSVLYGRTNLTHSLYQRTLNYLLS